MTFLNPFLLIGLIAVAVPLLIHLINLSRPRKIQFSTLAFFESLRESTLKRIQMKRWLMLLLRAAAILMMVFALARPYIPSGLGGISQQGQPAAIGIFIDNSPSMDQVDRNGPYLDQLKRVVTRIIEYAGSDDRIILEVTNGASLELPGLARNAAMSVVEELGTANKGNFIIENLNTLLYRMEQAPQPVKRLYFVSDTQSSQLRPFLEKDPAIAENYDLNVVRIGDEYQGNVAITDIELESSIVSPDQPVILSVGIENFGRTAINNHFVSLDYQGDMEGQYQVNLGSGESSRYRFELIPGDDLQLTGSFVLEGDELTFDNRRYFSINIPDRRLIAHVRDQNGSGSDFASYLAPVLDAAGSANELLEIIPATWDDGLFDGSDLPNAILLDGVESIPHYIMDDLVDFIQRGGGLLFMPSANGDLQTYNRFLERTNAGRFTGIEGNYGSFNTIDRVSTLREGHPLLDEIFDKTDDEDLRVNLPEIFYHYRFEPAGRSGSYRLLDTELGRPILMEQQFGEGRFLIYSIGADPGWSNFPVKPLFAPFFYRSVLYLAASESGGLEEHILGNRFEYELAGSPDEIFIEVDEQRVIPDRRTAFRGIMISEDARDWSPGFVKIISDMDEIQVSVNQHTSESDFSTLSEQELDEILNDHFRSVTVRQIAEDDSDVSDQFQAAGADREIWYWFIFAALFFLLTESFVARLFKAESIH
jgi:hypothetical protein